jgi:hypothetical protein
MICRPDRDETITFARDFKSIPTPGYAPKREIACDDGFPIINNGTRIARAVTNPGANIKQLFGRAQ